MRPAGHRGSTPPAHVNISQGNRDQTNTMCTEFFDPMLGKTEGLVQPG